MNYGDQKFAIMFFLNESERYFRSLFFEIIFNYTTSCSFLSYDDKRKFLQIASMSEGSVKCDLLTLNFLLFCTIQRIPALLALLRTKD